MKLGTLALLLLSGLLSWGCLAEDSNLTISGNVMASPCVVDTDSANQTIDFGQGRSRDFLVAGSVGEWRPFAVLLTQCPITTRHATVLLTGSATSGPDGVPLYANLGSALYVGIQIADGNTHQTLGPGSRVTLAVDNTSKTATLSLVSRLYSTGQTGAGQIRGAMQLDFTYQ
ncbi:fimbrial protein [Serratia fonticola]|uniref:fimbrial protein n=1 Tax=Serratia fonticola TaxID=47917 RepID=UPI000E0ECCE9|nr:fimbrial protein [Serratia fonticola]RDL15129.1 minor fimbrial subunit [Serratia fonticola]